MHNENIHVQSIGKIHKILFDNTVRAGVRTAPVTQDDYCMRLCVLPVQVLVPDSGDVVADKFGCVMVGSQGQISGIFSDIIYSVRDNLRFGKRFKVMVVRLWLSHAERLSIPLEIPYKLFLLGIYTEDWQSKLLTPCPDIRDLAELCVPFLDFPHRQVFDKRTVAKAQGVKYLTDIVFRDITAMPFHAFSYLGHGHGYPEYILILRKPRQMRLNDELESINPFRMFGETGLATTTVPAHSAAVKTGSLTKFTDTFVDGVFACSHNFTNFVDANALLLEMDGPCGLKPSSLTFVEQGHEYCEQYYRIHFENKFNFQDFNLSLITGRRIKECIVAFDPSYIPKSGKKTFGTGRYWSGCAKQAKWGLDICGLTTCQARSENKLNFHFNTALTVVNLARIDMIIIITQEND